MKRLDCVTSHHDSMSSEAVGAARRLENEEFDIWLQFSAYELLDVSKK